MPTPEWHTYHIHKHGIYKRKKFFVSQLPPGQEAWYEMFVEILEYEPIVER